MSFQLLRARLTESNLKEHTESFVDRKTLQEQFILNYVLEQSQKSNEGTFRFISLFYYLPTLFNLIYIKP